VGFEPTKAEPADLQSAPVDRLGTPPRESALCRISQTRSTPLLPFYRSAFLPSIFSITHNRAKSHRPHYSFRSACIHQRMQAGSFRWGRYGASR
ncbi:MAG TPA: hypothetical protein DIT50_08935, partial [Rhodocyclaceae bacterium]|nr:hypothetical protein [Rhodocyclaceae bacterium]